jgi:D-alanine-D-alanine ligase
MSLPRLLLTYGGRSGEHDVSVRSATEVLAAIDTTRWSPALLAISRDGSFRTGDPARPLREIVAEGQPVADPRTLKPAVVFPLVHGTYGEDGRLQGMLEMFDLPYVGSGVLASALCMDKGIFKRFASFPGSEFQPLPWVEGAAGELSDASQKEDLCRRIEETCGYPCFVKPANLGSSVGISKATDRATLETGLQLAGRYDDKIVVEKGIDAREIELAVLGNGGPETQVSEPGEIVLPEGAWYDYDNKYENDVASLAIPAQLEPATVHQLKRIALASFRASGCRGLARVDFLVDRKSETPWLNELNTLPGFTSISMYPKLMDHVGVPYSELITRLCELGIAEHQTRARLSVDR